MEDLMLLRWLYSPKWYTNSLQSKIQYSWQKSQLPFFDRNWHTDSKIQMEMEEVKNSQNNLGKICWRIILPDFKTF